MVRMERACKLEKKVGPLFFKFSLISNKNHYKIGKGEGPRELPLTQNLGVSSFYNDKAK